MIVTRDLTMDWGVAGLAGTLAYRVVNADSGNLIARTTAGVAEFPAGSGQYHVKVTTWDTSWVGRVVWDDGSYFSSEGFDAGVGTTGVSTIVSVTAPVNVDDDNRLSLVQGDDHDAGDRLPTWTITGYAGPSLAAGTAKLRLLEINRYQRRGTDADAQLEVPATLGIAGSTITVTAAISAAQSALLSSSPPAVEDTHKYQIVATAGGKTISLLLGPATVTRRIEPEE